MSEPHNQAANPSFRPSPTAESARAPASPTQAVDLNDWLEAGLAMIDPKGRITEVNESFAAWLDRPTQDLIGNLLWDRLKERCPAWAEPLAALLRQTGSFAEQPLGLPNGAQPTQWFKIELARHLTGGFVRFHSTLPPLLELGEGSWNEYLHSESARREMFVRLLRAESHLHALTERWPGVIFSQRADFTFRFVSPKIEDLTGVSIVDWQSKPHLFWHMVHEGDVEELRHHLRSAKEATQPLTLTYRIRHAHSGRVAYVMEYRKPSVSRTGLILGYEGVWLDVTRQTLAEKRLSSAAWKETLSVLTMGLAHDFGNVMAGIHALSESFLEQVGPDHEFNEGLTLIKRNAHQAIQLVHRIINLHQGKTGESNYHNLNEVTTELADLVRKVIPRRVHFSLELCPRPLPVYLDAEELRQVVINLVLNAIDAMPIAQEARLIVRTAHHPTLPALPELQGAIPRAPAACLSVQDSGSGIKSRHRASLFAPFFTTKPANKGSGLGLYNARLFVERHHGGISVETQEGAGTTFHLWLPEADFSEIDPGKSCWNPGSGSASDHAKRSA